MVEPKHLSMLVFAKHNCDNSSNTHPFLLAHRLGHVYVAGPCLLSLGSRTSFPVAPRATAFGKPQ